MQALKREHEERLAAVEDHFSQEVKRLSLRVEDANNLRHRDVERAMDEMDDMRRRLVDAHKRSQDMLHARADEQIAQLGGRNFPMLLQEDVFALRVEKLSDVAQYEDRIRRLEVEG